MKYTIFYLYDFTIQKQIRCSLGLELHQKNRVHRFGGGIPENTQNICWKDENLILSYDKDIYL